MKKNVLDLYKEKVSDKFFERKKRKIENLTLHYIKVMNLKNEESEKLANQIWQMMYEDNRLIQIHQNILIRYIKAKKWENTKTQLKQIFS